MLEPLYKLFDQAALLLWTWLGIRRRWLVAAAMAGIAATHVPNAKVGDWVTCGLYLLFTTLEHLTERKRSAARCNELSLHVRRHVIVVGWQLVMAAFLVSDIWRHEWQDFAKSLSCVLWVILSNTLIPTGPRKHIKLPQLLPAPVAA